MKPLRVISQALVFALLVPLVRADDDPLAWPQPTKEARPWSYWWWLGSAVDEKNLTKELTRYRDAGWGGVHIIPIYGAKGWEEKYIEYLSPKWMEMLKHTCSEARRLGLGVDMTTGTGWPFGGPNVTTAIASSKLVLTNFVVASGAPFSGKLPPRRSAPPDTAKADGDGKLAPGKGASVELQSFIAISERGERLDLTDKVDASGQLDWAAPAGKWRLFAMSRMAPIQRVKRAAPGAEGSVLDPFSAAAMRQYLARFDAAFAGYRGPLPRAQYHDSYEYYGADWTPALFEEFTARRGYDPRSQLPAFFGQGDPDVAARVKADYRETMSELHLGFLKQWAEWARAKGFLTRNQAHGSPGNILDHYAAADIPETEMYASDRSMLVSKFASSAAHVTGKRFVSSETGTWLKQHFNETLADLKPLLDEFFVAGINHVVFHGTVYSPDEASWPGWLFYAATQLNPRNSIWRDAPALAAYIARCQSVLQSGRPDNDVLLYWPIHDLWHNPKGTLSGNSVHHREWFEQAAIGKLAEKLWARGFTFDYVSDRQLAGMKQPGGYRAVVVPACERMPLATMEKLLALAKAGTTVIFEDHLPTDVPGLSDLERRRAELAKLVDCAKGCVKVGEVELLLAQAGIAREAMTDHAGLLFIRRAFDSGRHYFIANHGEQPLEGWVTLAMKASAVVMMDPMSGRVGVGASRQGAGGRSEVYLQLLPGESVIVRAFAGRKINGPEWACWKPDGEPVEIAGNWQVKFIAGGPVLPAAFDTATLASWTELGGEEAQRFAGTTRYSIHFDAPSQKAAGWRLGLGKVCQSARVHVNGRDLGTVFAPPFHVVVDGLKPKDNVLEVEVTNLSANRIRDLDRRGAQWKVFHDINFISLGGRPFDAANWPLTDSGLLGPVKLVPVKRWVCD
ncbi:MAG: hypothetical protein HZA91_08095 [Verrucomicrobia bacterium]|nr:hypothetical protein [Verrucomicrobiota bacterium]